MFRLFHRAQPALGPRHPYHPGWLEYTPTITVRNQRLRLRPLEKNDGDLWSEMRIYDQHHLQPVEPTVGTYWEKAHSVQAWREMYINLRQSAYAGHLLPFVIELNGEFAGQLTIGNIQHGTVSDAWIGYWVFSAHTGKGVATAACALGIDHAFARVGLHRLTATHLPDNHASNKVLTANGFKQEGYLRKNLHINGQWRDHILLGLTRDDYPTTATNRLMAAGKIQKHFR
ncbi:MAG: GNAT family protein [Corynebacterium sp.]|uniref:GNAT family N-acetyltransferase n=1 Tax=Corynebacterium sp. TaxID=1720 RepID=UPI0026DB3B84|nr:GNAT family protein [Corynebacterium sp.]MDO4761820.1 GNAT family protein [Corynebacterium sp.]